jgi:hypothetical protein
LHQKSKQQHFQNTKTFIMNRLSQTTATLKDKTMIIWITAVLALVFVCSLQPANAASAMNASRSFKNIEQALVYERAVNPYIGITVENAAGQGYVIADKNGKIILKGKISSDKTFFVATSKLAYGSYQFLVGGALMQQFIIQ